MREYYREFLGCTRVFEVVSWAFKKFQRYSRGVPEVSRDFKSAPGVQRGLGTFQRVLGNFEGF